MTGPIVNLENLDFQDHGDHKHFQARRAKITNLIGGGKLGCSIYRVPPGKKAWPFHSHHANEELYIILEGMGIYRYGSEEYQVRTGDIIAAPTGGADQAHQLVNTSEGELRYIAVSTMESPDIMEYPDSEKFGVFAGAAPGGDSAERTFSHFGRIEDAVGYWEDER